MTQWVLASNNAGKTRELSAMLAPRGIDLRPQSQWQLPSVAETGLTFIENALLKARFACQQTGLPALADDSGLIVDALQGQPGIYSARFAGENASDADNNKKLLHCLHGVPEAERGAHYYCVLVLLQHAEDPCPLVAEGRWRGRIATAPEGEQGFGYDPIFFLPDLNCTVAALTHAQKNSMSHRANALQHFFASL
jgi:XTP/dITP diphosphohydrolase